MNDCIFCRITAGEIPSNKAYEDEQVLAFYDIAPQAPVHVLVVPKKHISGVNDLTDAEFILFSDDVATALEGDYPVYATFVTMPGVEDTVQLVIVETVVEELQADARNMRHIFPYEQLVARKMLPAGLDHDQLHAFYNCLAGKVNSTFVTLDQFVNAVMADTVNTSTMQRLEGQCANDLFDWEITEVEVIETN